MFTNYSVLFSVGFLVGFRSPVSRVLFFLVGLQLPVLLWLFFLLLTSFIVWQAILDCLSSTESLILSIWFWMYSVCSFIYMPSKWYCAVFSFKAFVFVGFIYIYIYIYYIYIYIYRERERDTPLTPWGEFSGEEVIVLPLASISCLFVVELRSRLPLNGCM